MMACDRVPRVEFQLHDWEDQVQATHGVRETEAIRAVTKVALDRIGTKVLICEFGRGTRRVDVGGVELDHVARFEDWRRYMTMVIVHRILVFCLGQCCLGLF
jgi:hypothetical protein